MAGPVLQALVRQYVYYSEERGGETHTPAKGIPRGCSLSPLIGGSLPRHIDSRWAYLPGEDYCYVRSMDDFLLLTRPRWQLCRGPALSPRAIKNQRARRLRLYEPARAGRASESEAQARGQAYELRWMAWSNWLLTAASRRKQ